jgi:hypothetical protein
MEQADLIELVANAADLSGCRPVVCRVVNDSNIGEALLADKLQDISSKTFSEKVNEKIQELHGKLEVTVEDVAATIAACTKMHERTTDRTSTRDKAIVVKFLGADCVATCADVITECTVRTYAYIKERAWDKPDGLEPLAHELWVMQRAAQDQPHGVNQAVLVHLNRARKLATEITSGHTITSFKQLQNLISKKSATFCGIDRSFLLEVAWLEQAATAQEKAVLEAALHALPDEDKKVNYTQALHIILELRKHDMFLRSNDEVREKVASLERMVTDLSKGINPKANDDTINAFKSDCLQRASFFFESKVPIAAGGVAKRGLAGIVETVRHLNGKVVANEKVEVVDLEPLRPFWFLLDKDNEASMKRITKYAVDKVKGTQVIAKVEGAMATASAKKKSKSGAFAASSKDSAKMSVMKFF